jgi:Fe-S cluster biogenesis protein NfuA
MFFARPKGSQHSLSPVGKRRWVKIIDHGHGFLAKLSGSTYSLGMDLGFRMHAERTPNPNSIKWVLSQAVADVVSSASFGKLSGSQAGSVSTSVDAPTSNQAPTSTDAPFPTAASLPVEVSPLASPIREIDGVESVFLGPTFVTVTKSDGSEWTELAAPIVAAIKGWAATGESALGPAFEPPVQADDDAVVAQIRTILERDVRPYVEQDGGEISFAGYRDGVVEVILQGACAGCPSSSITLKMGIEARLKEEIPEVKSVVAL